MAARQAAESHDRTALLLAELEDAREQQLASAALAERNRIARELHDVLAHSLSGLAIQAEGLRLLSERENVSPPLREGLDRVSELARLGLVEAKRAVGVLRDGGPPASTTSPLSWSHFAALHARRHPGRRGRSRPLGRDAGLAVYRGVQESLTRRSSPAMRRDRAPP